ncbi:hypothetical protein J6590_020290 [Homalodisca vitripennis]|nr:hypothetical protein J6590_020290 [Homalodisca vitripennis]
MPSETLTVGTAPFNRAPPCRCRYRRGINNPNILMPSETLTVGTAPFNRAPPCRCRYRRGINNPNIVIISRPR